MDMTREKLLKIFPEFELVQDADLKEKAIRVWLKACGESEWENLESIPFSGGFSAEPDNLVYHTRMVTQFSYEVAKKHNELAAVKVNMDYIVAGALLHDFCKVVEYSPRGGKTEWGNGVTHAIYGVCLAYQEKLPIEIIHIIASHTEKLGMPNKSLEAIIIHKCDDAAAAGAYLVSRNKVKSGGKWVDL